MLRTSNRGLVAGLVLLAALLVANSVLGPLLTGVIEYHYGDSMTYQGMGLDAVALGVVVPVALAAAWLVHDGHLAGPVLAFLPGVFAAYMAPQYVIGPDYLGLPGNNEQFFPLHLAILLVGVAVVLLAWQHTDRIHLRPATRVSDRRRSWVLVGAGSFVLLRWLPVLPALVAGSPTDPAYLDNPTAFLLIAVLDLGLVVPGTLTAAAGLRSGTVWSRPAAYVAIGFFAVVPLSVAAMAITMVAEGDPLGSIGSAVGFGVVALLSILGVVALYRPLFSERAPVAPRGVVAGAQPPTMTAGDSATRR